MSLDDIAIRRGINVRMVEDIDSWSIWKYQETYRKHLGASSIGASCLMKLWATFRWLKAETRTGRMYRLLQRGNREEPHLMEILTGIGFNVFPHDPKTGKQWRMRSVSGHYGGSLDGIATFPVRYGLADQPALISCKTAGSGAHYTKMLNEGIKYTKPEYWAQECAYGYGYGINHAVWAVVNKNDDTIHIETEKLDLEYGAQLERKAQRIIFSREPFEKISKSPAFVDCAMCNFKGICHKGEPIDKNCRSCINAVVNDTPHEDGSGAWYCQVHNAIIPDHIIVTGCDSWNPIFKGE